MKVVLMNLYFTVPRSLLDDICVFSDCSFLKMLAEAKGLVFWRMTRFQQAPCIFSINLAHVCVKPKPRLCVCQGPFVKITNRACACVKNCVFACVRNRACVCVTKCVH